MKRIHHSIYSDDGQQLAARFLRVQKRGLPLVLAVENH
jgi:hypothetical protein